MIKKEFKKSCITF